jgi:hypothetical protein
MTAVPCTVPTMPEPDYDSGIPQNYAQGRFPNAFQASYNYENFSGPDHTLQVPQLAQWSADTSDASPTASCSRLSAAGLETTTLQSYGTSCDVNDSSIALTHDAVLDDAEKPQRRAIRNKPTAANTQDHGGSKGCCVLF